MLQAGSETSRIDLPAGTDVVLTAKSDKVLKEAFLKAAKTVDEMRIVEASRAGPTAVLVKPGKAGEEIREAAGTAARPQGLPRPSCPTCARTWCSTSSSPTPTA